MMARTRRSNHTGSFIPQEVVSDDPRGSRNKKFPPSWIRTLASVIAVVILALALAAVYETESPSSTVLSSKGQGRRRKNFQNQSSVDGLIVREIFSDDGVQLILNFAMVDDQAPTKRSDDRYDVSLGPHAVKLEIKKQDCSNPRFWLRLTGDALVPVTLSWTGEGDTKAWMGTFSLPFEGSFVTDGRWYGCGADGVNYKSAKQPTRISAKGVRSKTLQSLFPESAWVPSSKFVVRGPLPTFIWSALSVPPEKASLVQAGNTVVSQEATPINGEFRDLSNYELVCWVGSKSAEESRTAFLSIREKLYKFQRPFKFHLYPLTNFEKPDQLWEDQKKRAFRKCKHVLVSVDEMEKSISQEEYRSQVTRFLHHLVKCMVDPTFPIWMFTVNEPPMNASSCKTTSLTSTEHPCNSVLKDLFAQSPFPKHVRLLDNTDVSYPQFDENIKDVFGIIAMRIFAVVGTQVANWRAMRQRGAIDGLHRGDNIETNPELLVPYDWN